MHKLKVIPIQSKYSLDPCELACILVYLQSTDKTFAWSTTVGKESNSKNKSVLAYQWFKNDRVQRFMYDHNVNTEDDNEEDKNSSDALQNKVLSESKNIKDGITSDNIKELLEHEYNKTTKQEKRVELLMKIAEFVGAKKTTEDSANLPVIYLPSRCKECSFRQK